MRIVNGLFMQITSELLESCEASDRRAQKRLYELFFKMHMGLCFSYLPHDEEARMILNTAFLKVITHINTVKNNPNVFYSWSRKIVLNSIMDEFRRSKRISAREISKDQERELESPDQSHSNEGLESLLEDDLKIIIAALPDNMRVAFMMFAVEGYSHKEICEQLSITEGTSKWLVHEARKLLKSLIEKKTKLTNLNKMVI